MPFEKGKRYCHSLKQEIAIQFTVDVGTKMKLKELCDKRKIPQTSALRFALNKFLEGELKNDSRVD